MTTIGILSDTHSYLDPKLYEAFKNCDEIWHAGDLGDNNVLEDLQKFKPTKAVFGNIDSKPIQWQLEETLNFKIEGFTTVIHHIGGVPPTYNSTSKKLIESLKPTIFVTGHTHNLKVGYDKKLNNLLYINPGAAGKQGFHKKRSAILLQLDNSSVINIELIDLGKR